MQPTIPAYRYTLAIVFMICMGCSKKEPGSVAEPTPADHAAKASAGSSDAGETEPKKAEPVLDAATSNGSLTAKAASEATTKTADAGAAQDAAPKQRSEADIAREEAVKMLLEPKLASMSPNEANAHYSAFNMKRVEPVPEEINLVGSAADGKFKICFAQDDGQWSFTNARLEFPAAGEQEAEADYRKLSEILRARFGAPKEVMAQRPFLGEGYPLSDKLEAYVGAVLGGGTVPHTILSIIPAGQH